MQYTTDDILSGEQRAQLFRYLVGRQRHGKPMFLYVEKLSTTYKIEFRYGEVILNRSREDKYVEVFRIHNDAITVFNKILEFLVCEQL